MTIQMDVGPVMKFADRGSAGPVSQRMTLPNKVPEDTARKLADPQS